MGAKTQRSSMPTRKKGSSVNASVEKAAEIVNRRYIGGEGGGSMNGMVVVVEVEVVVVVGAVVIVYGDGLVNVFAGRVNDKTNDEERDRESESERLSHIHMHTCTHAHMHCVLPILS
jgi:hypothetical protein